MTTANVFKNATKTAYSFSDTDPHRQDDASKLFAAGVNGSIVLQIDVANTLGGDGSGDASGVSVIVTNTAGTVVKNYLVMNVTIPANSTLQVLRGQKMILLDGDVLRVLSDSTVDVICSWLDNVNT